MEEKEVALPILDGSEKGDRNSQELLYKQFYSYGMGVCLRYTSSREEAVEVLNDGFLKVFKNLKQFERGRSFKSWFRKILIHTAINHLKKYGKHKMDIGLENIQELQENGGNVLDGLGYEDTLALVQTLTPVYRTVFNLYVMEGYSHEEIAGMLGISVGASKSNLSRARANLRCLLKKNHEQRFARLG